MLTKQEKEKLTTIERRHWQDERMVKYCVGEAAFIYDLRGKTIVIDKKKIKTRFCFGYSDSRYDTEDFDRAETMSSYARSSQHYFTKENHKNADYARTIERLNKHKYKAYAAPQYSGSNELYYIGFVYEWESIPNGAFELTDSEKQAYKLILVKAIKEHHKKIMSYLKRYGMEKVDTWTYWRDR